MEETLPSERLKHGVVEADAWDVGISRIYEEQFAEAGRMVEQQWGARSICSDHIEISADVDSKELALSGISH